MKSKGSMQEVLALVGGSVSPNPSRGVKTCCTHKSSQLKQDPFGLRDHQGQEKNRKGRCREQASYINESAATSTNAASPLSKLVGVRFTSLSR